MQKGFIKLERKIISHWVFQDSKKLKWWLILLIEVNYSQNQVLIGNQVFTVNRGQSAKSLRTWAKLFDCGTKSVSSFFELLQADGMITKKTVGKGKQSTTLITIENYEDYQGLGKRKGNAKETQEQREGHTIKERKKERSILSFSDFWDLYNKKVDRKKSESKYKTISEANREAIKQHIPKYILSQPDPKYRKNPITYLNNESWNDEIVNDLKTEINYSSPTNANPYRGKDQSVYEENARKYEQYLKDRNV